MDLENGKKFRISRIKNQVRHPDRKSIFIEGEFAFGISLDLFLKAGLAEGHELTAGQIEQFKKSDDTEQAIHKALDYLGLRMRSRRELRDYLYKKQYDEDQIEQVLHYCTARGYLNDHDFAAAFTRDQLRLNKSGRQKIRLKLQQKGVAREIIEDVLREEIPSGQQTELARQLALKKMKTLTPDLAGKQKLYRFLIQRGFDMAVVSQVITEIFRE